MSKSSVKVLHKWKFCTSESPVQVPHEWKVCTSEISVKVLHNFVSDMSESSAASSAQVKVPWRSSAWVKVLHKWKFCASKVLHQWKLCMSEVSESFAWVKRVKALHECSVTVLHQWKFCMSEMRELSSTRVKVLWKFCTSESTAWVKGVKALHEWKLFVVSTAWPPVRARVFLVSWVVCKTLSKTTPGKHPSSTLSETFSFTFHAHKPSAKDYPTPLQISCT